MVKYPGLHLLRDPNTGVGNLEDKHSLRWVGFAGVMMIGHHVPTKKGDGGGRSLAQPSLTLLLSGLLVPVATVFIRQHSLPAGVGPHHNVPRVCVLDGVLHNAPQGDNKEVVIGFNGLGGRGAELYAGQHPSHILVRDLKLGDVHRLLHNPGNACGPAVGCKLPAREASVRQDLGDDVQQGGGTGLRVLEEPAVLLVLQLVPQDVDGPLDGVDGSAKLMGHRRQQALGSQGVQLRCLPHICQLRVGFLELIDIKLELAGSREQP
mmetsp:Transcript_35879/g.101594  ORF Transcript_35879/g.101594 Transcript_35879/m.101594 type:complete len:264 (-) Transcript_35879:860-1651(-)